MSYKVLVQILGWHEAKFIEVTIKKGDHIRKRVKIQFEARKIRGENCVDT